MFGDPLGLKPNPCFGCPSGSGGMAVVDGMGPEAVAAAEMVAVVEGMGPEVVVELALDHQTTAAVSVLKTGSTTTGSCGGSGCYRLRRFRDSVRIRRRWWNLRNKRRVLAHERRSAGTARLGGRTRYNVPQTALRLISDAISTSRTSESDR